MSEVGRPSTVVVVTEVVVVVDGSVVDVAGSVVVVLVSSDSALLTEQAVRIKPSATNLAVVRIKRSVGRVGLLPDSFPHSINVPPLTWRCGTADSGSSTATASSIPSELA